MPVTLASKSSPMRLFKIQQLHTFMEMRSTFMFLISFAEIRSQTSMTLFLRSALISLPLRASSRWHHRSA